ncbi:MAG: glycosyltransferase, partial [Candidatus Krumholzibacteria bacterium]|nr:glycosyltransferase [Candidatus Krumholzibacteria bacterium]
AQEYPGELVEIIVVSDGSTDRTAQVVRELGDDGVILVETPGAVGKAEALNLGVARASNDVIVFADARQRFEPNVIAELVAMLADQRVGAVSGELVIERGVGSEVGDGVGLYWSYEKLIRRMESNVYSTVGATGSIYAVRKGLYAPLERHALLDDFLVPMRIVLQGYRVLFVRSARAHDLASATVSQEFARKVRTLAGNFQAMALEPRLLNPAANRVFFQFVSHKLARLVVPYAFALALVASALAGGWFYGAMFWVQVMVFAAGFLNHTRMRQGFLGRLLRLSWTFTVLNAAAVVGLWVYATGRERTVWKKA